MATPASKIGKTPRELVEEAAVGNVDPIISAAATALASSSANGGLNVGAGSGAGNNPPASASAPLDVPTGPQVPTIADVSPYAAAVMPIQGASKPSNRILDAATGEAPDPEALLEKQGAAHFTVTSRLVQEFSYGEGQPSTMILVMAKGATVTSAEAEQLKALLTEQSGGPAPTNDVPVDPEGTPASKTTKVTPAVKPSA